MREILISNRNTFNAVMLKIWLKNYIFNFYAILSFQEQKCMLDFLIPSPIAQSVEQVAVNHWVGGSSPSRGAIICNNFSGFVVRQKIFGYTLGILLATNAENFCKAISLNLSNFQKLCHLNKAVTTNKK